MCPTFLFNVNILLIKLNKVLSKNQRKIQDLKTQSGTIKLRNQNNIRTNGLEKKYNKVSKLKSKTILMSHNSLSSSSNSRHTIYLSFYNHFECMIYSLYIPLVLESICNTKT